MGYPLQYLANWSPFRLDALGLVTLLGAEEVCLAIGALQPNRYTEYLPLFGSFLVAGDKCTNPLPGFTLYNVSDGVYVPVITGWLSRWLIANLSAPCTYLIWEVNKKERRLMGRDLVPIVIGIIGNGGLIGVAALQGDYYGVANAIAMSVSVLVRCRMIYEKRRCLNDRIQKKEEQKREHREATTADQLRQKGKNEEMVKVIITTPDDKAAVFEVQRCFISYMVMDLVIPVEDQTRRRLYRATRAVGWLAFAIHVVCIGQAYLLSQLLSVGILASATISTILGLGVEREEAGGNLRVSRKGIKGSRRDALLELRPTEKEEAVLQNYWQLPHKPDDVEMKASASEFWEYWRERIERVR